MSWYEEIQNNLEIISNNLRRLDTMSNALEVLGLHKVNKDVNDVVTGINFEVENIIRIINAKVSEDYEIISEKSNNLLYSLLK